MNLAGISVKKPVTILMITLIVIILGVVSLSRLPIDLLPQIEYPVAIVSTTYQGVGPQEIENIITKPVESAVATVSNIKNISSMTSEGSSVVIAEFNFGTDMNFAALEMREKIDMIKGSLPDEAGSPMVLKIDPNAQPIIQLSLSNDGDISKLQAIAEDTIQPRLERLDGVASVDVSGGYKNQVEIKVDEQKLRGYGLSIDYLSQIIGAENLNLPGGQVQKGKQDLTIRTMGEFNNIEEIKNLPIPLQSGGVIYLRDVSDVKMGHQDVTQIIKTNGKNSVSVSVQKQSGKNTVEVTDEVNAEIDKLKIEYPNISFNVAFDQSEYIKQSIKNVSDSAVQGAILAILILYIFLRNIRTTFIIGVSIPISIIATFVLIYFDGITLNMMTLGGLALGVGMLVDNSIVVLENIYRFREEGYSRIDAAIKGTSEVSMAVVASTLTTVAVFLPIVFVEGITSTLFKELALTVTFSLMASLIVALTLIPMMSSKLLKIGSGSGTGAQKSRFKLFSVIYDLFDRFFESMESGYKKLLNWALDHRKRTVLIAVVIFITSMASIISVGAEFFPQTDEGTVNISVSLPEGSELENTDEVMTEIEAKLEGIDEIDTVFTLVGSGGMASFGSSRSNSGNIGVELKDMDKRDKSSFQVADEIRNMVKDISGAEISVSASSASMGLGSTPVSISIKGDDLDTLRKISDDFKKIIESVEGTREVETGLSEGIPEVQIKIDRKVASQYGLTASTIASAVRGNVSGKTATTYKYEGEEMDVVIKGDGMFKESIENLKQVNIQTPTGSSVPLGQVADVAVERGPVSINRENQVRVVSVTSQIIGRDLKSITDDITKKLDEYNMPQGYSYKFGGEREQQNEAFADLGLALGLAVILVYMVIASQFESLLHPFTIMLSVPLSLAGGAFGLFITRRALSVPAMIGVIILAGIVVNNAIVLIDYIITRRKSGEDRRTAVVNAGPIRLRPILMTTLTTVLGLIPLALGIGEGAEIQAPLATVVIGGLTLSTVLTLVFIPVMYTIFDDFSEYLKRKAFKSKNISAAV